MAINGKRKGNSDKKAIINSLRKDTFSTFKFFFWLKLYILHFKITLNVFKGVGKIPECPEALRWGLG